MPPANEPDSFIYPESLDAAIDDSIKVEEYEDIKGSQASLFERK